MGSNPIISTSRRCRQPNSSNSLKKMMSLHDGVEKGNPRRGHETEPNSSNSLKKMMSLHDGEEKGNPRRETEDGKQNQPVRQSANYQELAHSSAG